MYKKIISVLLVLIMACMPFVMPVASADTKADEYKKKISELKQKEKQYQQQLNSTKSKIKDKKKYSDSLVGQIDVLSTEIGTYHEQISKLEADIAEKQKKINAAKKKIERQMNSLKKRIRTIYMAGDANDLEIILGAKDFTDFLDKMELIKILSAYDKELIDQIQKQLDTVTGEKQELEANKKEVEDAQAALEKKQAKLTTLLKENEEILSALYNDESDAQRLLNNAAAAESEVQGQLSAYYKKLEAQRKAAAARQQQATQPANTSNPTNSNPTSTSGGRNTVISSSGFTWPVPGYYYVISPYGENRGYSHKGIDITGGGIMGATVVAAGGGTVIASNNSCTHNWGKSGSCGCGGGYGNYVLIAHANGKSTLYGHLTKTAVSTGATVSKGQTIGYVGTTGWSTGAHLHFETRSNGATYNPMSEY